MKINKKVKKKQLQGHSDSMEGDKNNVLLMETKAFETLKEKSIVIAMVLNT